MRQTYVPGSPDRGLPEHFDFCPNAAQIAGLAGCSAPNGTFDSLVFPCEGFSQVTSLTGGAVTSSLIDAPRLADPMSAGGLMIPNSLAHANSVTPQFEYMGSTYCGERIDLGQVDAPATAADAFSIGGREGFGTPGSDGYCSPFDTDPCPTEPFGSFPPVGIMRSMGSGFYYLGVLTESVASACVETRFASPLPPFGCRILGQTTTQVTESTTANRFGSSISVSGTHLLIGAPNRTARKDEISILPTLTRDDSGVVYMLPLHRPTGPVDGYPYALPATEGIATGVDIPYPHNYIIRNLGYTRCNLVPSGPGHAWFDLSHPLSIVGAAPGDRIGEVAGLHDINKDGLDDFVVGGVGTNQGRGAVYIIYRRSPEVEGNYLLEQLQYAPSDPNRLNGMMILGEPGENLGTSLASAGSLNDDFNDDDHADLLIGSPNASPSSGLNAGAVAIVFGGRNLLNPAGGYTLTQLRNLGYAAIITGAQPGDNAGMTVANAGDVDGDGVPDILIAAPNATPRFDSNGDGAVTPADISGMDLNGDGIADDLDGDGLPDDLTGAGIVYVVLGGKHLTGTISLSEIGTANLPGFMVAGHRAGDHLGGGVTQNNLASRGVASAGDIDGDGRADLLLSSVTASPEGKTNAGEVYLLYGLRP